MNVSIHIAKAMLCIQNDAGEVIATAKVEDYAFDGNLTMLGEAVVATLSTVQAAVNAG